MHPTSAPAISIRGLTKRFGRTVAVRNLTLEVFHGEVFGFLGLNGAGKTTTIRVLLDLLRPTSGSLSVMGHDCQREGLDVRAAVGYLPGELTLYGDMTGRRMLDLLDRLGGRRAEPEWQRGLLERFELGSTDLDRRIREYSTGMKRKLGLVQAFQTDPPLLILDEPTEGLDPLMQEAFYQLLGEVRQRGRTVFMSSHVLSEVERACDRIGVLRRGELRLIATVGEVTALAPRRVEVVFDEAVPAPGSDGWPPGVEVLAVTPRGWTLSVSGALGPLVARLSSLPVKDLMVREARLEDVVMAFYRDGEAGRP